MRFAIVPLHLSKVPRLPGKRDARSYEVLRLSCKIILANLKIWCAKMQPLSGNQRPDLRTSLMNMSSVLRLHAKCIFADPLQMSHACHHFWNATKPSRFAYFWEGAQSLAPATRNDIWTSKSGANMWCFVHFDFEMCFAPQRRALFRRLDLQKWSEHGVFCTFWLGMCFAPQRRALFRHLNFQKCSEPGVLCAFWPGNVLRGATTFSSLIWPSGATNHWKNRVNRDFSTFSRTWIFFLLTLSLLFSLLLSSSLFFSLLLSSSLFFSLLLSSSLLFSPLLFSSLLFSSLALTTSAFFRLSILSEVWLPNFLRLYVACQEKTWVN